MSSTCYLLSQESCKLLFLFIPLIGQGGGIPNVHWRLPLLCDQQISTVKTRSVTLHNVAKQEKNKSTSATHSVLFKQLIWTNGLVLSTPTMSSTCYLLSQESCKLLFLFIPLIGQGGGIPNVHWRLPLLCDQQISTVKTRSVTLHNVAKQEKNKSTSATHSVLFKQLIWTNGLVLSTPTMS